VERSTIKECLTVGGYGCRDHMDQSQAYGKAGNLRPDLFDGLPQECLSLAGMDDDGEIQPGKLRRSCFTNLRHTVTMFPYIFSNLLGDTMSGRYDFQFNARLRSETIDRIDGILRVLPNADLDRYGGRNRTSALRMAVEHGLGRIENQLRRGSWPKPLESGVDAMKGNGRSTRLTKKQVEEKNTAAKSQTVRVVVLKNPTEPISKA